MKILYGVPGEGMGHATRSKVIISHLLRNHDVQVVSSARAYKFLNESFPGRVHEIKGYHLAYKDAAVSKSRTAGLTLKNAPETLSTNLRQYRYLHESFRPDLVISDFESFSYLFAKHHRLPVISIDNMQIINRCQLDIPVPASERTNFALARRIVQAKVPRCRHYLITTFFQLPVVKENTTLVPPIIRPEIVQAKPAQGQHVLVYQSSTSQKNLIGLLQQMPQEQFLVYGFNREEQHGNVTLKAFSETGFIHDLASSKAVLTNGGFSLISEAVYLNKPVCAIPLQNQFEQYLNAAYIEKLGYGRNFTALTPDAVKAFLYDLPLFARNIGQYRQQGNQELFRALDELLEAVTLETVS